MDRNQVLRLLASAATTMLLTACGASMKPDHPQVFDDFKERRPPKENVFVEGGNLEQLPEQRASRFTPYTGPTSGTSAQSSEPDASPIGNLVKDATEPAKATPRMTEPDGTSPTVPSREQRTVWERLKNRFSFNTHLESKTVAERKVPLENGIMLADLSGVALAKSEAQGSTDGYSYYEAADEIISGSPVYDIQSIQLASINASASLVDVPEPQSYEGLKQEGEKLAKQDLKNVPAKPKKQPTKPEIKKPAPTAKKPVQAKAKLATLPEPITMADASDYIIQDKQAEIVYSNGQPMVTGFIGVIRSRSAN